MDNKEDLSKSETKKRNIYEKSKIYKLVCDTPYYYIGATTNSLPKRLSAHKQDAIKNPERKVYKYFNSIKWGNVKIILIKSISCQDVYELKKEEDSIIREHLNNEFCLNSVNAFNTIENNEALNRKRDYNRY